MLIDSATGMTSVSITGSSPWLAESRLPVSAVNAVSFHSLTVRAARLCMNEASASRVPVKTPRVEFRHLPATPQSIPRLL